MKHRILMLLAMMLIVAGAVGTAFAADDDISTDTAVRQALEVRYEHLGCKVDLTTKQIDLLEQYIPGLNLTPNKDRLNHDMEYLKELVDTNNKTGFDTYVAQTFRPDFQEATQGLIASKANFRKYNLSNDTKEVIIGGVKEYRMEYAECVDDKELKMGDIMLKHMENWDAHWGRIIDRMAGYGVNTSEMDAVRSEFELKTAEFRNITQTGNATLMKKYMDDYRQQHMHYAARFEVEKLKGYKNKLEPEANGYGMNGRFGDVDAKIATADKYAQKNYKYKDGEYKDVWNSIKEANDDMRNASKDVLKERMQQRAMQRTGNNIDAGENMSENNSNHGYRGGRR